jgi:hypothetical protein
MNQKSEIRLTPRTNLILGILVAVEIWLGYSGHTRLVDSVADNGELSSLWTLSIGMFVAAFGAMWLLLARFAPAQPEAKSRLDRRARTVGILAGIPIGLALFRAESAWASIVVILFAGAMAGMTARAWWKLMTN